MEEYTYTFGNGTAHDVFVYRWSNGGDWTERAAPLRGAVQIAHGMAETAKRYERLASFLVRQGFVVYANDHRGHGRTAGSCEELGWLGEDGFNGMIEDMDKLGKTIRREHPDLPFFLFGHSMGSFLTQKMMYDHPALYSGFILSGTNGPRSLLPLGKNLARLQALLQGREHRSLLLNMITFGSYNKKFLPARTAFDWLSRDEREVDKYIEDPFCGFLCSTGFFIDFFKLLQEIHLPSRMEQIPKDKPVYILGGDKDPVGLNGKGVRRLADLYAGLRLQDVEMMLYPEGRHEMLNEINREEVTQNVADWLKRHLPAGPDHSKPV